MSFALVVGDPVRKTLREAVADRCVVPARRRLTQLGNKQRKIDKAGDTAARLESDR